MYWKMYADYRKEHIITTGMCTPRLAEIAHCEIRNLQVRGSDDWAVASIKDILNNFFNKDAAAGLLFNPFCENMMIVPKPLLEILMPGDKEKPPFYREPKQ